MRWLYIVLALVLLNVVCGLSSATSKARVSLRVQNDAIVQDGMQLINGNATGASPGTDLLQAFNSSELQWIKVSNDTGAALLAIVGVLLLLFGYRLLRPTLFLAGFCLGFAVIFILIRSYSTLEYKWCLLTGAIIGFVLAILALCFMKLGLVALGAFLGFWIATFVLSFPVMMNGRRVTLMQRLSAPWQYYLIVVLTCILCGILTLCQLFQKFTVILTTSLGGSFSFFCFIDHFAKTGFSLAASTILVVGMQRGKDMKEAQIKSGAVTGMLVGCVLVCVVGVVFQYWRPACRDEEEPNAPVGENAVRTPDCSPVHETSASDRCTSEVANPLRP